VAVIYTSSVQGYVEPCGCTGDPLGGVARLAALVDEAKQAYGDRVLFLDGGDMLFEHATDTSPTDLCQTQARLDLLASTYGKLGLAGTVLGPLDDVRGPAFRDALVKKAGIITLGVVPPRALVEGAEQKTSLVKELGPAKIGVTAFRADDDAQAAAAHDALLAEAQGLVGQAVDAIVVLAQSPRDLTKQVVAGIAGIDVVIQGRSPGEAPVAPETLPGGAVLVAAGVQAQYAGVLELVLDAREASRPLVLDDRKAQGERRAKVLEVRLQELKKQVADAPEGPRRQFLADRLAAAEVEMQTLKNTDTSAPILEPHVTARAVPLPRGFPEEPGTLAGLTAYTKSIPSLVAQCEASTTCPAPEPGAKAWVGAEACAACHAPAVAFWKQQVVEVPAKDKDGKAIVRRSGHAHAWETLVADRRDKDRTCVGCHSTGFDAPGGPCTTTDIVKKNLTGVQCEACHGPGSAHVASAKAADIALPDEAKCRSCHRVPHIPTTESFAWNDRLKLVLGAGHGEKKRATLGGE
jgi:hypothetical protein